MRRSLHYFWPRAESNLYAEPKRLVEAGLAEAREEWNGDRKRSVYSITKAGRDALREWLASPSSGQRLESEPHLRLLFANYGTKEDVLATIERVETDAAEAIEHFAQISREYARGDGLFPERIHVNVLIATLSIEQARAAVSWAQWARKEVEAWVSMTEPDVGWASEMLLRAADPPDRD